MVENGQCSMRIVRDMSLHEDDCRLVPATVGMIVYDYLKMRRECIGCGQVY